MKIKSYFIMLIVIASVIGIHSIVSCQQKSHLGENEISWLSVYGNKIVNEQGMEIILRGIQIDFGSARGDVGFIDDNDPKQQEFFDNTISYITTEDDFKNLQQMEANAVRFSLNTYKDFENEASPFTYREQNFQKLDQAVSWAETYNIYLIISMRQSPGGHNSSPYSGNDGLNMLWHNQTYQQRLINLWEKIAVRYANKPIVIGYDLLNEPEAPDKEILNKVYQDITSAIRKVDEKHIIFLEGNLWGIYLDWIESPPDVNTAFSIHFYVPGSYAVEGNGTYPGFGYDKNVLRESLQQRIDYAQELNRPVFVGEFGAVSRASNYLTYDAEVIELLEEHNLGWNYWHYKNLKGYSDTQAIYYTDNNNKYLQLMYALKQGADFSSFTSEQIGTVLESLETSCFFVKQELKNLIINSLKGTAVPTNKKRR
jgi:aryl-phospho-beta-D-glucosidase BglC (GH1 family)